MNGIKTTPPASNGSIASNSSTFSPVAYSNMDNIMKYNAIQKRINQLTEIYENKKEIYFNIDKNIHNLHNKWINDNDNLFSPSLIYKTLSTTNKLINDHSDHMETLRKHIEQLEKEKEDLFYKYSIIYGYLSNKYKKYFEKSQKIDYEINQLRGYLQFIHSDWDKQSEKKDQLKKEYRALIDKLEQIRNKLYKYYYFKNVDDGIKIFKRTTTINIKMCLSLGSSIWIDEEYKGGAFLDYIEEERDEEETDEEEKDEEETEEEETDDLNKHIKIFNEIKERSPFNYMDGFLSVYDSINIHLKNKLNFDDLKDEEYSINQLFDYYDDIKDVIKRQDHITRTLYKEYVLDIVAYAIFIGYYYQTIKYNIIWEKAIKNNIDVSTYNHIQEQIKIIDEIYFVVNNIKQPPYLKYKYIEILKECHNINLKNISNYYKFMINNTS